MLDWDALEPEKRRPLRRVEYDKLVAAGAFANEHVELLHGWIVTMSPQGRDHVWIAGELTQILTIKLHELDLLDRFSVRPQCSYAASEYSEPEPDIAVVARQRFGDPLPDRSCLMIEVAVSSLRKDRMIKRGIYADNGVPEYWILDVGGEAVEVYTEPRDGEYRTMTRHERGEVLRPAELPGVEIAVIEILPPRA